MSSEKDMPILLKRTLTNSNAVESRVQIGRHVVNIKSTFRGEKKYSDLLFELACQKLSA